jgi:hypothetical protein
MGAVVTYKAAGKANEDVRGRGRCVGDGDGGIGGSE